ncbi:alginate lyase family protein [Mucilaginibacter frigoritolerans]|nr:alginate lyase family protein [Mucilaginibacter frigoritolerans]
MKKFNPIILISLISAFICLSMNTFAQRHFVHPGLLQSQASLDKIYYAVQNKTEPQYGSYELLEENPLAQADYKMRGPFKIIARDGDYKYTKPKMEADFSAAYLNALMWAATKKETHAKKSLEILEAYADSLQLIPPTNDAPLLAGLEGNKIVNAAEILRYTYKGITASQIEKIKKMIVKVFLPVCDNFYNQPPYTNGNWGACVTNMYLGSAVFLDNLKMYNKAVDFYLNGYDNGNVKHYIDSLTGQVQESGRDQVHTMLGIGCLASTCEIAYNQGDDLYSAYNNRLLLGFEYVAKYNLGYNVPFQTYKEVTGKYSNLSKISDKDRGMLIPIYEMVYNHYVRIKDFQMPYTAKMIAKMQPEGFDSAHMGFGTLLFYSRDNH